MRINTLAILIALLSISQSLLSQKCIDKTYPLPTLGDSIRNVYESNLESAFKRYQRDSLDRDNIIWYGRRLAYLGKYREAIEVFTKGIDLYPNDARFLRHRGHRYITLRCFDKAIADLEKAAVLINDREDEIEPDGIPNSLNIPTGTLHTNTWYHLGLAHYLSGNYKKALAAYEKGIRISDNNDMFVAMLNWLNITLRKLGRKQEADKWLTKVNDTMQLIENRDYLEVLLAYKNRNENRLVEKTKSQETLSNATLGFALGNYYLLQGDDNKAREIFNKVLAGKQWASFGFIAAEAYVSGNN